MLLNPYRFTRAYSGLDIADYSGDVPALVFSTRRINSSYSGPLLRIRRSSDNAELDFGSGLAMGEYVDWSAVDTWLSGSTAFVAIWYDQSGNGFDLEQSTAGKQPVISTASTVSVTRSVLFDGVNDVMQVDLALHGSDVLADTNTTAYGVIQAVDTGFSTWVSVSATTGSGGGTTYFRANRYGANFRVSWGSTQATTTSTAANALEHIFINFNGSTISTILDDGVASASAAESGSGGNDVFNMGADAASHIWEGHTLEFIWFKTDQSASNKADIIAEQNSTYTIF